MVFRHHLPEFIPSDEGLGDRHKLTISGRIKTPVPSRSHGQYRKMPSTISPQNASSQSAHLADIYLLRQLLGLYGDRPFQRGNLDAGRLNRLWFYNVFMVVTQNSDTDPEAQYRLNVERARELVRAN